MLAAAQLYRVDAGIDTAPSIPFRTRIMRNIAPKLRNAFVPRSMPRTVFGPCETVPGGYWIYQGGYVRAKVKFQTEGRHFESLATQVEENPHATTGVKL